MVLLLALACVVDPEVAFWSDANAAEPVCAVQMDECPAPDGCTVCACLAAICRDDQAIRRGSRRVCYGCPATPDQWIEVPDAPR
jgi:hypothetical protein